MTRTRLERLNKIHAIAQIQGNNTADLCDVAG